MAPKPDVKPSIPATTERLNLYLRSDTPRLHRPSSRWTAVIWIGLTGLLLVASRGDVLASLAEAYWSGVNAYQPTLPSGPGNPATGIVPVGTTPQSTGLGGQPIQPGGPFSSNDQPGVGANLGYPTDSPGGSGISVGPSSDRVGIGGAGGPLPGMGSYRYGRIGNSYGELVG